jgi:FkbM family methyltransferase
MIPMREDVIEAYRTFLERDPENDAVIQSQQAAYPSTSALVKAIIGSAEWQRKNGKSALTEYTGIEDRDISLLQRFLVQSQPTPGFFIDFVGSRTDINYVSTTLGMSGVVEGMPIPNSVHAEAIEWVGTLKAVAGARDRFVSAELGAGWGPWVVSSAVAARTRGISDISLIAVEGDPGHFGYLQKHVRDNGFDPDKQKLLHGIVGAADGFAYFPEITSQSDWGASAIFTGPDGKVSVADQTALKSRRHNKYQSYSLQAIFGEQTVDLCHIDIQGSEADVILAGAAALKKQVRWIVVGTHSRSIDGRLIDILDSQGWQLENEKPCKFEIKDGQMRTMLDGAQVWRNSALT